MKQIIPFLCFGLLTLFACEQKVDLTPAEIPIDLDLANMDLSGLELDWEFNASTFDFGLSDRSRLSGFMDELVVEFLRGDLAWFEMQIAADQTIIQYGESDASMQRTQDSNVIGWSTVTPDDEPCSTGDCLKGRLETILAEAGVLGARNCVNVRVNRGPFGAGVCYQAVSDR